jgi:hypothetical protein
MPDKKSFLKSLSDQLIEWDAQIADLKKKAQSEQGDLKVTYDEKIKELTAKKAEVDRKIEELKKTGEEAWITMKDGVEKAAGDLKKTFSDAFSKFKK